jgi:hypothetical protein
MKRQVVRQGEKVIWTPLAYYDDIQTRGSQLPGSDHTLPTASISPPATPSPSSPHSLATNAKVQHKRRAYEELTKQQAVVLQKYVPSKKTPLSKSSVQCMKRKPRAKPDSFIQKLLDRFDPPKFRNS